jgi:hypothetical protein
MWPVPVEALEALAAQLPVETQPAEAPPATLETAAQEVMVSPAVPMAQAVAQAVVAARTQFTELGTVEELECPPVKAPMAPAVYITLVWAMAVQVAAAVVATTVRPLLEEYMAAMAPGVEMQVPTSELRVDVV